LPKDADKNRKAKNLCELRQNYFKEEYQKWKPMMGRHSAYVGLKKLQADEPTILGPFKEEDLPPRHLHDAIYKITQQYQTFEPSNFQKSRNRKKIWKEQPHEQHRNDVVFRTSTSAKEQEAREWIGSGNGSGM
jgi:hypothetical protein